MAEQPQVSTAVLLRTLIEAAARIRHVIARRAGLGETELVTLEHLADNSVGPAELARRLTVSTAASTGIVDRLEARGHVERRPHAHDRRRTEVHLTDSGRAEVVGHLMPMFLALRDLETQFTAEELEVVQRYLRGATAAVERVEDPPG
ncbi:MarR family transcriptional regulator [Nocardioides sp. W7]|uniref:MarR family winged helix-turn-helix transcriptional regulator n=1 Tax=Nocardioides sp. W7 TaxID=2931390 RepID=UPI001FD47BD0|nr:MarR family transcriptional regulator [Nocardioides sp. W7]